MSTTAGYNQLISQVDELRGRWRWLHVGRGILATFAVVAATVVCAVAADNLFALTRPGRWLVLCLVIAALVLAALAWVVRSLLEDRRDDFFAAVVEARHPDLQNRLINGLQLGRGNDYGSPRLIQQIVTDALDAVATYDLPATLDRRPLARAAGFAAAAVFIVAAYAGLAPARFMNGLSRVVAPFANVPPYTATQFAAVKPGDRQVLEGLPVEFEVALTGRIPATVELHVRSEGKPWRPLVMKRLGRLDGSRYGFTVRQAAESFEYYATAGDGRSPTYHLEVVRRPRIETIDVRQTPPAYTDRKPRRVRESDGEITALCGSTITWQLRATKPLKEAVLLVDAADQVPLKRGADDRTWKATFVLSRPDARTDTRTTESNYPTVMAPARYQVRLLATDGSDYTDPLWRTIGEVIDQPPTLTVVAPGRDVQVKPDEELKLDVLLKDDYGAGPARIEYRVNDDQTVRELARFEHGGRPKREVHDRFAWSISGTGLKAGDVVQYWAQAEDRNNITGPGAARSRTWSLFVTTPEQELASLDLELDEYAQVLEELIQLQSENRAQTNAGVAFETLIIRETLIRTKTLALKRSMQRDAATLATVVETLEQLYAGPMADCIRLLEGGRDSADQAKSAALRSDSLPIQDALIEALKALLARFQRNDQARKELKKLAKTDQAAHTAIVDVLSDMMQDLERLLTDETELVGGFEKLPKKDVEEANDEAMQAAEQALEEFEAKWNKWAKGSVDELTKLPTGFVDDFALREDVNRIFEEIEKTGQKPKAAKLEVALEDLGAGLATKMLEDLEVWMMDTPEATQWVLEEPVTGPIEVPEMPLPDALEDMVGDLLQEAEEFDEEADDITSAWGDNLNQAGWGVADGPISSFSAKGKTGNELPNNMEVGGRSGDGRRGKSSGQMVGDTARGLEGRKTPARVNNERYEPGQVKEEAHQDPGGATGGGKKAGAGRRGLQGGTPPDFVKDMQRLGEKQAGLREKADQVAQRLETAGVNTTRLNQSLQILKRADDDLRDFRYDDAANRRREGLGQLKTALTGLDRATAAQLSRARELPAEMREQLLQSADEGYPEGYEALSKNYFRALSEAEQ